MNKIYVLGMGPGSEEYILPICSKIIQACEVLIGGKRNLQYYENMDKELIYIGSELKPIMNYVKAYKDHKKIAFLLSGDTGFYSMLGYIKQHFNTQELEVIPGISSFQYMAARIGECWQNAFIGSIHGRGLDYIEKIQKYGIVILLTDQKNSPQAIAKEMIKHNIQGKQIIVGENLSYINERILFGKPEEIIKMPELGMAVVVIKDDMDI